MEPIKIIKWDWKDRTFGGWFYKMYEEIFGEEYPGGEPDYVYTGYEPHATERGRYDSSNCLGFASGYDIDKETMHLRHIGFLPKHRGKHNAALFFTHWLDLLKEKFS